MFILQEEDGASEKYAQHRGLAFKFQHQQEPGR